jgi:ubiquitin carboxyl-terminal hydrolase 5/13
MDLHVKATYKSEIDQHPIFMNVKMTEKVLIGNEKPKEVTKLAIGKPGGVDAEADRWDTNASVFCTACKVTFLNENDKVANIIKSVMLAQSAFNDSTVQEWELELASCAHTKNLDQSTSTRIADKAMAHCGDCDLKQNLWLCMVCGHLGCGRKNYDGTGGNNHAVDHAQ